MEHEFQPVSIEHKKRQLFLAKDEVGQLVAIQGCWPDLHRGGAAAGIEVSLGPLDVDIELEASPVQKDDGQREEGE